MPVCLCKNNSPLCPLAVSHEVQLCTNMNNSAFDGAYTLGDTPFVPPPAAAACRSGAGFIARLGFRPDERTKSPMALTHSSVTATGIRG